MQSYVAAHVGDKPPRVNRPTVAEYRQSSGKTSVYVAQCNRPHDVSLYTLFTAQKRKTQMIHTAILAQYQSVSDR